MREEGKRAWWCGNKKKMLVGRGMSFREMMDCFAMGFFLPFFPIFSKTRYYEVFKIAMCSVTCYLMKKPSFSRSIYQKKKRTMGQLLFCTCF